MLKLFVWDDVFCDYTCGVAFALAETKEEAVRLIVAQAEREEQRYIDELKTQPQPSPFALDAIANADVRMRNTRQGCRAVLQLAEEYGDFHVYESSHGQYVQGGG